VLTHGKPLVFGKNGDKGIRLNGHALEIVRLDGKTTTEADLIVHDETDAVLAFLLSTMQPPAFPTPIGVFRAVDRPTYEAALKQQVEQARAKDGPGDLDDLFNRGDTWVVN
jgi:2-oxoglutarate ferredoxin oxidoreductase subunit beta